MSYTRDIAPIGNSDARLRELERLGEKAATPVHVFFDALWDPFPPVRHAAAAVLARRMTPELARVLAALCDATDGPEPGVQQAAGVKVTSAPTLDVRRAATLALRSDALPDDVVQTLVTSLSSDDHVVRYHALLSLYESAEEETLREICGRLLEDDDPGVVVVAAQLAAEQSRTELLDALAEAFGRLERRDKFQVALAIAALDAGVAENEAVVEVLLSALRDEHTTAAAAQAVAMAGIEAAVPGLKKVTKSWIAHPLLRVEAAAALVRLGDSDGTEFLEKMLHGRRRDTRGYAIELVAKLGLEQFRDYVEEVARSDDYHADTAVVALRQFADTRALTVLREIADGHIDPEIRELAAETSALDGSAE